MMALGSNKARSAVTPQTLAGYSKMNRFPMVLSLILFCATAVRAEEGIVLDSSIECMGKYLSFQLNGGNQNVDASKLPVYIVPESGTAVDCNQTVTAVSDKITIDFAKCHVQISKPVTIQGPAIIIAEANMVLVAENGVRKPFWIRCTYNAKADITSGNITVTGSSNNGGNGGDGGEGNGDGNAPTDIKPSFVDKDGNKLTEAKLGDSLNFTIGYTGDYYAAYMPRDCYFTDGSNRLYFVRHGCPVTAIKDLFREAYKMDSKTYTIGFNVFKFGDSALLRINCAIDLCLREGFCHNKCWDNKDETEPSQTASPGDGGSDETTAKTGGRRRRRRSADEDTAKNVIQRETFEAALTIVDEHMKQDRFVTSLLTLSLAVVCTLLAVAVVFIGCVYMNRRKKQNALVDLYGAPSYRDQPYLTAGVHNEKFK